MVARAEAFERQDLTPDAARDRDDAGARRDAVDEHGAGAAFAEPAAVFRSVQFEIVAQHIKQRGVGSGADVMDPAVDFQADRCLRHAHGSDAVVALQNNAFGAGKDIVCIQTCKRRPRQKSVARFMNRNRRQLSYYSAAAFFAPDGA